MRRLVTATTTMIILLSPPVFASGNPQITFGFDYGDFSEIKRDPEYPEPSERQLQLDRKSVV